jgi:YD repeat-containing protein
LRLPAVALALVLAAAVPAVADVVYVYDDLNRLVRVIREDGEAGTYHYDAVGNILRITGSSGGSRASRSRRGGSSR